jgi:hypothetical protein
MALVVMGIYCERVMNSFICAYFRAHTYAGVCVGSVVSGLGLGLTSSRRHPIAYAQQYIHMYLVEASHPVAGIDTGTC